MIEEQHFLEEWTDDELNTLIGDWNGEDTWFMSQGDRYHEDDVHIAQDILDARD